MAVFRCMFPKREAFFFSCFWWRGDNEDECEVPSSPNGKPNEGTVAIFVGNHPYCTIYATG